MRPAGADWFVFSDEHTTRYDDEYTGTVAGFAAEAGPL